MKCIPHRNYTRSHNIDSFYFSLCTPPPLLEEENAPLEEVTAVYYAALINFLECDLMHAGLVQQLGEMKEKTQP